MKKLIALLAFVCVAGALATAVAFASGASVSVRDNKFGPRSVTVTRGASVTWTWSHTKNRHNITGRGFHSATKSRGSYTHRFNRRGTFTITCTIHPGMEMTVRVR